MNNDKKKTKISAMSQKEYIESVRKGFDNDTICMCPFCKSEDIEWDIIEVSKCGGNQRNSCNSCSAIWEELYNVVGYTVIQEPVKNKIVGTDNNVKGKSYVECPSCNNKNIIGTDEAKIEQDNVIMQNSICSDCGMTFKATIGFCIEVNNMKIKDIAGNSIEACLQFEYREYVISASTISGESIKVFKNDEDIGEVKDIPTAIQFVDNQIIKSRLKNLNIERKEDVEKWFKLNKDHEYWKNSKIGTIFSYNKNEATWYSMDGLKWNGEFSKEDIVYWKKFGFEECTKEEALKSFPEKFKWLV